MVNFFPRFSVVIPNFNNGATLARAIISVLNQSYPAHEVIVIDDGSTDHSEEVASQFGDRVVYLYQSNAGVSTARNVGVERSTGDWIAFLDADDVYYPDRLRKHAEWIAQDPDIDFLLADQEARTPSDELLYSFMSASKAGRALLESYPAASRIQLGKKDFKGLISDGFGEIRTLSLPRSTFLKLGGFPVHHKIGEDLYFFIRLYAFSERAGVVPEILATYYIFGNSAIRKDPVRSMELFVQALDSLQKEISLASVDIQEGYFERCRSARLSLAYAYLRKNLKRKAVFSVVPTLLFRPTFGTLKDLLSVCRGFSVKALTHDPVAPISEAGNVDRSEQPVL